MPHKNVKERGNLKNPFRAINGLKWMRLAALGAVIFVVLAVSITPNAPQPSTGYEAPPLPPAISELNPVQSAQFSDLVTGAQDVQFERLSFKDGLSQSSVMCIWQDQRGFMWFCTEDGLDRFDGYEFKVYRHDPNNPDSISSNYITAIYEDHAGNLWVGTNGGGLNEFDWRTETFKRYLPNSDNPHSLSNDRVLSIYEDHEQFLWVGTAGGLNRLDPSTGEFTHFVPQHDDPNSLSHSSVRSIFEDHTGTLWIGTLGGLERFDRTNNRFIHYQPNPDDPDSLRGSYIVAIVEDQSDNLWVATDGGLNKLNRETGSWTSYQNVPDSQPSPHESYLRSMYVDHFGILWIGTYGGGLEKFDPETEKFVYYQNDPDDTTTLSNNYVWSIYEDRSGVIWVGTFDGISKYDRGREGFIHYVANPNNLNSLSDNRVLSICEDSQGYLWVGTYGDGLNRLNRSTGDWKHYRSASGISGTLSSNTIRSIFEDHNGELWVGTEKGLDRYDPETDTFSHYRPSVGSSDPLSDTVVFPIYEDRSDNLWVGTLGGGLNRIDPKRQSLTHFEVGQQEGEGLSNNSILAILQDYRGYLWVGTWGGGLDRLDPNTGKFTHYRNNPNDPNSLSQNNVYAIHEDGDGILWIGTWGGGLNRFDPRTGFFKHYRTENGLPNDVVYGILSDVQGYLWMSTNYGLSLFDPKTATFKNYDAGDGLQSNGFNAGAYYQSRSGEMFFGGGNGLNAFYPEKVIDNPYIPPVALTLLTQTGEPVHVKGAVEGVEQITLPWPGNYFEFEFAALSYIRPDKNQYAYMLVDFDKDWNYIGNRRFGRYTNLPGGAYTLRLKAANNDGVWNEQGISIRVRVMPPFWQTWWFRISMGILVISGVLGGYRLRLKSIEDRNRDLSEQVAERTYEIEQRRKVAEGLRDIMVILNSERSLKEGLDYIVIQLARLTGAEAAVIYQGQKIHLPAVAAGYYQGRSRDGIMEELPEPAAEWISNSLNLTRTLIVPNYSRYHFSNPGASPDTLGPYNAVLAMPLQVGGEICGGLALFFVGERSLSKEDLQLIRTFADQASLAIANARLRDRVEQAAVESERNRLARDLHDSAKQQAFAAMAQLAAAQGLLEVDIESAREHLGEGEELVYQVLQELSFLIHEMRPPVLQEVGLAVALRNYILDWAHKNDVETNIHIQNERALQPDVEYALFRVAQEALANIARHSKSSAADVELLYESDIVSLVVTDCGCGFDLAEYHPGMGLRSMRERVTMLNGRFHIDSQTDQGTCVRIIIPVKKSIQVE